MMSSFCGSPNVDSEKIVEIEGREGNYKVPLHEFTKHALLGEYAYYNPMSSLVACNIFDVCNADPREHFLASLVISFLSSSELSVRDSDGFIGGDRIIKEMMGFNFLEEQVQYVLRRLANFRLIETPHGHYREVKVAETELPNKYFFRTTSIGVYHLRHWAGSFSFLDATSTDTPIFDSIRREAIFNKAESFLIKDRFLKAEEFRSYLEDQWNIADINSNYFDFKAILQAQRKSFDSVSRFLEKKIIYKR